MRRGEIGKMNGSRESKGREVGVIREGDEREVEEIMGKDEEVRGVLSGLGTAQA